MEVPVRARDVRPSVNGEIAGQAARIAPVFALAGTMLGMPHHQPPPPRTIPAEYVLQAELTASVKPVSPDTAYVVQAGDTLWSIARQFYGNGHMWPDIYYANQPQIADPNVISIGQVLAIPGSGTARAATNAASATPAQAGDMPSSSPAQAGDQYKNPIGPGLTPGRVDMGVDYGGAGPVYALGNGKITSVYNSGWPGGGFIGLQLSDGSGRYVYYAEDISPAVQAGQTVTAGQLIGHATGGGIEVGWAAPPGTGQTMAAASGQDKAGLAQGDPGYYPTAYGVNFSNLIRSLSGPAGIASGPVQGTQPGAAAAQAVNQQTGGTQTSDQQPGDQQARDQENGDQENGQTQTGAAQPSPVQPGPAQAGDPQSSPAQTGSTPGTTGGYLQQAAQGTGLPLSVVRAQVQVESGGQPGAISPAGAEGPYQFMPSTWATLGFPAGQEFNWATSTHAYISFMRLLLAWSGGNVRQALAAYNAGQGNWQAGLGYADQILSMAGQ
jgi:LysM repeat protein